MLRCTVHFFFLNHNILQSPPLMPETFHHSKKINPMSISSHSPFPFPPSPWLPVIYFVSMGVIYLLWTFHTNGSYNICPFVTCCDFL